LIAGTIIVNQQLSWMQNQDLGFDKEQLLVVDAQAVGRQDVDGRANDILNQFEQLSVVQEASLSQSIPGRGSGRVLFRTKNLPEDDIRSAAVVNIGRDWFTTYGVEIVAGRAFDPERDADLVGAIWMTFFPEIAFNSFFLDDDFNRQYQAEERLQRIFTLFSVLAVLIACLGLFGLAAFTAQQRTKEIGIRKVMGASVGSLVGLLSREFAILVLVGLLIAVPVTLWGLNLWLEPFSYRIEIEWWVFLLSGAITLAIALLTVGWQAMRAASADPIKSLRYE